MSETKIILELEPVDAAAVLCGLGLLSAMFGDEDAEPPESVLAMIADLSQGDAVWVVTKLQVAIEQQILGQT